MTVSERFLKYVSFNTRSDEESVTCPSTEGQRKLGKALVEEMKMAMFTAQFPGIPACRP